MKKQFLLNLILLSILYIIVDVTFADAAKTGSYNFCTQFPAFPECGGWRTKAINDNYWFCDYVYLENFCRNPPNPEKQIPLRTEDYCCRYIGSELQKEERSKGQQIDKTINTYESILPLIIWTDKDHYDYRDKVIVYGKFDFTNPSIKQNINETSFFQTGEIEERSFDIDIKLNGKTVLRDIQVNNYGWFSAYFFLNNGYSFSTQNNLLEVEYIITNGNIPPGGPKTHATYHFTTGDISKTDKKFDLWLDESSLPHKISYGVIVENQERFIEMMRHGFVKTRMITPEGYSIPIESVFSIQDHMDETEEFIKYGYGVYEIQVTYGNNTSKKSFEYVNVGE